MITLLLAMLACHCNREAKDSEPERVIPDPYDPPDIVGPWAAGAVTRELADPDGERMDAWVWFPALEAGQQGVSYDGLGEGTATVDAAPDCAEPHPVAVFSHAGGGHPAQSWFLAERLATQGWVSVAPTHRGSSRGDNDLSELALSILRRPAELSAAYDGLLLLSETVGEPLAGCVDPALGFAVVGHGLGGSSALMLAGASLEGPALDALCQDGDSMACDLLELGLQGDISGGLSLADERVFAAFVLAPSDTALDAGGLANVLAPVGILGATLDNNISWDEVLAPTFDALTVLPRGLGGVEGAGHLSLSALCPYYVGWPECEEGGGYLPVEDAWEAVNVTAVPALEVFRGEDRAEAYLPPERAAVSWGWE